MFSPRQGLADYLEGYHSQVSICLQNEVTQPAQTQLSSTTPSMGGTVSDVNLSVQNSQYKTVDRIVQTLKNLCCALDEVETQAVTEAIKRLRHSANVPRTHSPKVGLVLLGLGPMSSGSTLTQMFYVVDGL